MINNKYSFSGIRLGRIGKRVRVISWFPWWTRFEPTIIPSLMDRVQGTEFKGSFHDMCESLCKELSDKTGVKVVLLSGLPINADPPKGMRKGCSPGVFIQDGENE